MSGHEGEGILSPWWGRSQIYAGETRFWQIGPLRLWVQRLRGEWRVSHCSLEDPLHPEVQQRGVSSSAEQIDDDATVRRFGVGDDSTELEISPLLADRAIVSRPDMPFVVPAGEEVVFFVSSPLWVAVSTIEPVRTLLEVPVFRPSDTWFGPSSEEGELCYATTTFCRLRLEDVPFRPHRCVTAVTVRNRADEALPLEHLRIPVHGLSLFQGEDGRLWSQDVTLERQGDDELAELTVRKMPPARASSPRHLAVPRSNAQTNVVVRAFNTLFS